MDKTINSKAAMNICLLFWYSNVFLVTGYSFNVCTCADIDYNCDKMIVGEVSYFKLLAFYTCRVLNG